MTKSPDFSASLRAPASSDTPFFRALATKKKIKKFFVFCLYLKQELFLKKKKDVGNSYMACLFHVFIEFIRSAVKRALPALWLRSHLNGMFSCIYNTLIDWEKKTLRLTFYFRFGVINTNRRKSSRTDWCSTDINHKHLMHSSSYSFLLQIIINWIPKT